MGVRNEATAPSAVQTTNGCRGRPRADATEIATGPSNTTVAASDSIWVSSAAAANMTSNTSKEFQSAVKRSSVEPKSAAVPVFSMAMPSGITPAIITKIRTSISR